MNLTPQSSQPSHRRYCIQTLNCRVKEEVKTCICRYRYECVTYSQLSRAHSDQQVSEAETPISTPASCSRSLVELISVESLLVYPQAHWPSSFRCLILLLPARVNETW